MSTNLGAFQSAVQLASGANLAIFALPRLGEPEIEVELRRWSAALMAAKRGSAAIQLSAQQGHSEFRQEMDRLSATSARIRLLALYNSVWSALYLVWCSFFPERPVDFFTITTVAFGAVPPFALLVNNAAAKVEIAVSRKKRAFVSSALT